MTPPTTRAGAHTEGPWGVVRQFADHRCMMLTDGAWIREGSCSSRPDLLLTPRIFPTRKAAEDWKCANLGKQTHVYVSRIAP